MVACLPGQSAANAHNANPHSPNQKWAMERRKGPGKGGLTLAVAAGERPAGRGRNSLRHMLDKMGMEMARGENATAADAGVALAVQQQDL